MTKITFPLEEFSLHKNDNLFLTCQNFIGLQEPLSNPVELINKPKNLNTNELYKTSWYGKDDQMELVELEDSLKKSNKALFTQPQQHQRNLEEINRDTKLSGNFVTKNSNETTSSKPQKKLKYFENLNAPLQISNKNNINHKSINRKTIYLGQNLLTNKFSTDSNENKTTAHISLKSKASNVTNNAIINKNSSRIQHRSEGYERDIKMEYKEYLKTVNALKSYDDVKNSPNSIFVDREMNSIYSSENHCNEESNSYIKDFIDICNKKESPFEIYLTQSLAKNDIREKEEVKDNSTIRHKSNTIPEKSNKNERITSCISDIKNQAIYIESHSHEKSYNIEAKSDKKISLPQQAKNAFTNNINIYLGNQENFGMLNVNRKNTNSENSSGSKEGKFSRNQLTHSKEFKIISLDKKGNQGNISPLSQNSKKTNNPVSVEINNNVQNNLEECFDKYNDFMMTNEFVNLGTKPNEETYKEPIINNSLKSDHNIPNKWENNYEINLFNSTNNFEQNFSKQNEILLSENKERTRESYETNRMTNLQFPVLDKNLEFVIESPEENSKNEQNETKIKEVNFVNFDHNNIKHHINDTITSTFSNNYANKITNQNKTIVNLDNIKYVMSIENFNNTNKNFVDLTNRNMVNSYLSNKNVNMDTEKKELLNKLMYFSNKNIEENNLIHSCCSNAANSKNLSPKVKAEDKNKIQETDKVNKEKNNAFNIFSAEINLFDDENLKSPKKIESSKLDNEKDNILDDKNDFFIRKRRSKLSMNVIKNQLFTSNFLINEESLLREELNHEEKKSFAKKKKISKSFSQINDEVLSNNEITSDDNKVEIMKDLKVVKKKELYNKLNKDSAKPNRKITPINKVNLNKKVLSPKKEGIKKLNKKNNSNLPSKLNKPLVSNHNKSNNIGIKSNIDKKKEITKIENNKIIKKEKVIEKKIVSIDLNEKPEIKSKKKIKNSEIPTKIVNLCNSPNPLLNSFNNNPTEKLKLDVETPNNDTNNLDRKSPKISLDYNYSNFTMDILNNSKNSKQDVFLKKYNELNSMFKNTLKIMKISQKNSRDKIKNTLEKIAESQEIYENDIRENFKEMNLNESSIVKDSFLL